MINLMLIGSIWVARRAFDSYNSRKLASLTKVDNDSKFEGDLFYLVEAGDFLTCVGSYKVLWFGSFEWFYLFLDSRGRNIALSHRSMMSVGNENLSRLADGS